MDQQQFLQLLESLLQPDTERVKHATAALNKDYYKSPPSLSILLQVMASHHNPALRQLAAVEARKLVPKHWKALPAEQKPQIRQALLQATLNEEQQLARHSSARVIAAIAKIDLEDGEWADLPKFLRQATTSPKVAHREVGVYIFYTLLETLGDVFMQNPTELFHLFSKTIRDPESSAVRVNTMLALSIMAMALDADEDEKSVKTFQDIVPAMVQVLKNSIDTGDEDHIMQEFEVFQTLLGCDAALLNKHFGDLMHFMMEMASNTEVSDDARSQALSFLMQAVKFRRLKVQGLRIGEQLTVQALQIVTELDDTSAEEEDVTPARSALELLDILASSLPPSQVVVPLLKAIGPFVNSPDSDRRRAGILALGMCVEGAPDFIATQLKEILPMVLYLLEDSEDKVRSAALNGVARLADDLAEDMGKEHARLMPALVKNFDASIHGLQGPNARRNLEIIKRSCSAMDAVVQGLAQEDAAKYVPELVPRLSQLIEHPDLKVKTAAVGALGSIAAASKDAFSPYFEPIMRSLGPYVDIKDSEEELDLRAVVCDSLGEIAGAVGADAFQQYVPPLMQASEHALHLGHPRLRETSYILWSTLSKVYEENFAAYLDGVVKGLFESLEQEETELEVQLGEEAKDLLGTEVTIAGKKVKVAEATSEDDEDDIVEDGDDEDGEGWDDVIGVSAVAMEKEIAMEVVGEVVTHTKRKYMPFIQKTIETVLQLVEHSYEGVRKASISTLWRTYATLWGLAEEDGMEKWKAGIPLNVQPPEDLVKLGRLVMNATLAAWQDENDRSTVTDINRNIYATLRLCGPAVLIGENGTVVPQITNQLVSILTKKHPCQQDIGVEAGEDVLEESSEYDWLVIDTAMDAVAALASALGESFGELWKVFEKPILKYASSQEPAERTGAVGCIAECINGMGSAVTPYTTRLLKLLIHRLTDENAEAKSNAVYAIGLLCEKSQSEQELRDSFNPILLRLEPLLNKDQPARLVDNSVGCVSRMILRNSKKVPVRAVLPRVVELLPLKEDFEENTPLYKMIVQLYQAGEPTIQTLTESLMPAFQAVLEGPEEQLDDETRTQLVQLVQYLQKHGGGCALSDFPKYVNGYDAPPLHLHFEQSETFQVISGQVGTSTTYDVIDTIWTPQHDPFEIKPWVPHTFWPVPDATEDSTILVWAHPQNTPHRMDVIFFHNLLAYISDVHEKKVSMDLPQVMLTQHATATAMVWFPTAKFMGPLRWWLPWMMQAAFAMVARLLGKTPVMERYLLPAVMKNLKSGKAL